MARGESISSMASSSASEPDVSMQLEDFDKLADILKTACKKVEHELSDSTTP